MKAMNKFSSRTIIGMLIGWFIIFEGLVAFSIADGAVVEGIGGIRASTFQLAAVQLIALGIFISIMWMFKPSSPEGNKTVLAKVFSVLTYAAMVIVSVEGLVIVYIGGPVFVEGIGGITNELIVLSGAQLFVLGILSLRSWWLRDTKPMNWIVDGLGSIVAALLVMEGLTVMGIAEMTNIEGIGYIKAYTFFDAGLQLFIIGAMMFVLWTLVRESRAEGLMAKVLSRRNTLIIMLVLGGIVALEGVIAASWAGAIDITDGRFFPKEYVVAGCAQLFLLGLLSPLLWRIRHKEMGFDFTPNFITPIILSILAFEGVFAIGLSSKTNIGGIGTILDSTFMIAGEQLLVLALIGLMAWMLKDQLHGVWTKRIMSAVPIVCLIIIALEGLAASLMAANIYIYDIEQGLSEKYVLLGGAQMVILSAIALFCWVRSDGVPFKFKMTGTAGAMFVMLILPFVLVL
ncbi:MAG: hypothetical protein LUQ09_04440 [Methanomassiliicoccales archaeon]|nr:hypothetical protein [Methanomassiliicoccales archaeon]